MTALGQQHLGWPLVDSAPDPALIIMTACVGGAGTAAVIAAITLGPLPAIVGIPVGGVVAAGLGIVDALILELVRRR